MTDNQHTPGPWRAKGHCIETEEYSFNWVASVQTSNVPEWEANARLIAAAPELLDALQSILDIEPSGLSNEERQLYALARAAIAKATGQ